MATGGTDIDLLGAEGDPVRLKALVEQLGAQRPVVIIAITSPAAIALSEMAVSADCTRCHLQELTANASSLPPVNSDDLLPTACRYLLSGGVRPLRVVRLHAILFSSDEVLN